MTKNPNPQEHKKGDKQPKNQGLDPLKGPRRGLGTVHKLIAVFALVQNALSTYKIQKSEYSPKLFEMATKRQPPGYKNPKPTPPPKIKNPEISKALKLLETKEGTKGLGQGLGSATIPEDSSTSTKPGYINDFNKVLKEKMFMSYFNLDMVTYEDDINLYFLDDLFSFAVNCTELSFENVTVTQDDYNASSLVSLTRLGTTKAKAIRIDSRNLLKGQFIPIVYQIGIRCVYNSSAKDDSNTEANISGGGGKSGLGDGFEGDDGVPGSAGSEAQKSQFLDRQPNRRIQQARDASGEPEEVLLSSISSQNPDQDAKNLQDASKNATNGNNTKSDMVTIISTKTLTIKVMSLKFYDILSNKSITTEEAMVYKGFTSAIFRDINLFYRNGLDLKILLDGPQASYCPNITIEKKYTKNVISYYDRSKNLLALDMIYAPDYLLTILCQTYKVGSRTKIIPNSLLLRLTTWDFNSMTETLYVDVNLPGNDFVKLFKMGDYMVVITSGPTSGNGVVSTFQIIKYTKKDGVTVVDGNRVYGRVMDCHMDQGLWDYHLYCITENKPQVTKMVVRLIPPSIRNEVPSNFNITKFLDQEPLKSYKITTAQLKGRQVVAYSESSDYLLVNYDWTRMNMSTGLNFTTSIVIKMSKAFDKIDPLGFTQFTNKNFHVKLCPSKSTNFYQILNYQNSDVLVYATRTFTEEFIYVQKEKNKYFDDFLNKPFGNMKFLVKCLPQTGRMIFLLRVFDPIANGPGGVSVYNAVNLLYVLNGYGNYQMPRRHLFFNANKQATHVPTFMAFGYTQTEEYEYILGISDKGSNSELQTSIFRYTKNFPQPMVTAPSQIYTNAALKLCYYYVQENMLKRRIKTLGLRIDTKIGMNVYSIKKDIMMNDTTLAKAETKGLPINDYINVQGGIDNIFLTENPEWSLSPRIIYKTQESNEGYKFNHLKMTLDNGYAVIASSQGVTVKGFMKYVGCEASYSYQINMTSIYKLETTSKETETEEGRFAVVVFAKNQLGFGSVLTLLLDGTNPNNCFLKLIDNFQINVDNAEILGTDLDIGKTRNNHIYIMATYSTSQAIVVNSKVFFTEKIGTETSPKTELYGMRINARMLGNLDIPLNAFDAFYYPVTPYYWLWNYAQPNRGFVVSLVLLTTNQFRYYVIDIDSNRVFVKDIHYSLYSDLMDVRCHKPNITTETTPQSNVTLMNAVTKCYVSLASSNVMQIKFYELSDFIVTPQKDGSIERKVQSNIRNLTIGDYFKCKLRTVADQIKIGNQSVAILHKKANNYNLQQKILIFRYSEKYFSCTIPTYDIYYTIILNYNQNVTMQLMKDDNGMEFLAVYDTGNRFKAYSLKRTQLKYHGAKDIHESKVRNLSLRFTNMMANRTIKLTVTMPEKKYWWQISSGLLIILFLIPICICVYLVIKKVKRKKAEEIMMMNQIQVGKGKKYHFDVTDDEGRSYISSTDYYQAPDKKAKERLPTEMNEEGE